MIYEFLCAILSVITLFSLVFALVTRLEYKKRLERAKKSPAPTLDARQILHDLTVEGKTVLKIERLDTDGLFQMSPRNI